ncbi:glycosyltransferase family 2 protein [Nostoc sp. MG11]|uniref:glycosyltransferase family 2 protein n=1 Tax=Nostoc sp. MG11 TaxID=2721166 RepID=UPI00186689AB|nr:glycosyltransferase family 2 protein [Nostoc sp. MG11]
MPTPKQQQTSVRSNKVPNLIPVLTRKQSVILQILIVFWLINLCGFWIWWLKADHLITIRGMVLNSLLLAYTTLMPAYFFYFTLRMKRQNPQVPIPKDWRVAMVVTKAPSEPWLVVRQTLEAMLTQVYPHDTWLADEDPDVETWDWCKLNGVRISCRKGIATYHRPNWPRRTRCKEGNLAYFYDQVGYEQYDIVVQLDADHVPSTGYLEAMIRPFVDPGVGYVAAPSICDANVKQSWVVNARLFAEATLHGALQAGYNDGWAPLCIGSHYAVRTSALQTIGGLGPELAEDHTTTLMMNAEGWKGVFAFDAEAHGLGPSSFADCMTQEFQWSRSLMKVLIKTTPLYFGALPATLKFQFLFAQLWYPIFGFCSISGIFLPALALIWDQPWVRVSYLEFLIRITLLSSTTIFPVMWLKKCGCLRPVNSRIISWQIIIFQIARGLWILAGIYSAFVSCMLGRELQFKITPKENLRNPLPMKAILPYLLLGSTACIITVLIGNVKYAIGYYFLTLFSATSFIGVSAVALFLHHRETRLNLLSHATQYICVALGITLLLVASLKKLPLLGSVFEPIQYLTKLAQINLPATMPQMLYGIYDPNGDFKQDRTIKLDHHFVFWRLNDTKELKSALKQATQSGRIPLITLEPFPWNWNGMTTATLFDDILAGRYDSTLRQVFSTLKSQPHQRIYFRFGHEMEIIGQYPWSKADEKGFIAVYRYVHDFARREGATNLIWMWSPAGFPTAKRYWPGSKYVDLIGVSIYATKEWSQDKSLPSFERLMSEKYWFSSFYNKPMIAVEVGVNGSEAEKQHWLDMALVSLSKFPQLKGWVYFNQKQPDLVPLAIGQPDWALSPDTARHLQRSWSSSKN